MPRKALHAGKLAGNEAATKERAERYHATKKFKTKTFEELSAEDKDALLKYVAINAGLIKPSPASKASVVLMKPGENTVAVIKELRDATGMNLRDLEILVTKKDMPQVVKQGLTQAEADALCRRLSDAGATVEVREG